VLIFHALTGKPGRFQQFVRALLCGNGIRGVLAACLLACAMPGWAQHGADARLPVLQLNAPDGQIELAEHSQFWIDATGRPCWSRWRPGNTTCRSPCARPATPSAGRPGDVDAL
jgi:hypothetical protein